ncbi:leucine efflux protein LeuE [Chitinimonas arctica]|uniref:Leucine efflux protein LeuE n=1 Tax=Chitinimonas arctica TaxID=2594795 RepID=A0A516SK55_9NEIS|nr:LysE family transporter [Chitinimonas arctica]QDQ28398.1 leucine efflux protein LeuE [Chitinimonas arctica]
MPGIIDFPTFLVASTLLILSPGPGTLAILGSATGSRRAGFAALAGTSAGDALLLAAAAIGAAGILAANPMAFDLLKYGGGAYLVWLGIKGLLSREQGIALSQAEQGSPFKRSLFVTLLNPKAIIFFMAFFPQFVSPGASGWTFAVLGGIFIALNCLYQTLLIIGAGFILRHLDSAPHYALWVNRLLGAVFILFGLRLALG